MAEQVRRAGVARAALVVLSLLGLLTMHGIPDAMSVVSDSVAGQALTQAATAMHDGESMPNMGSAPRTITSSDVGGMDRNAARSLLRPPAVGSVIGHMRCGMDHGGCVAVLRATAHAADPVLIVISMTAGAWLPAPPLTKPNRAPRAPPDVSLIRLGISRT